MSLSLIVAASENQVIGIDGDLPWRLSADLKRFKQITMGHTIIMGRKTYDSIGRPLPGRKSIVITRQNDYQADGVQIVGSLEEAIEASRQDDEAFIMGGATIYEQAIDMVDKIYLTRVHATLQGDTFFPELASDRWQKISSEPHSADEKNQYDYSFEVYIPAGKTIST